jgi:hypothetical protein
LLKYVGYSNPKELSLSLVESNLNEILVSMLLSFHYPDMDYFLGLYLAGASVGGFLVQLTLHFVQFNMITTPMPS